MGSASGVVADGELLVEGEEEAVTLDLADDDPAPLLLLLFD